jgi:hypothetical protein
LIEVIEPRNRDKVIVQLAGPESVVLLDTAQEGDKARFARWDVEAKDTQHLLASSGKARGIHLRLAWPSAAPSSSRMQLFVRYTTVDGRKLEARRELFLTLAGQTTQRWTPRSTRREGAAETQISARDATEVHPGGELPEERRMDAATASDATALDATALDATALGATALDATSKVVPASATESPGRGETAPAWQPYR